MEQLDNQRIQEDRESNRMKNCFSTTLYLLGHTEDNHFVNGDTFDASDYFSILGTQPIQEISNIPQGTVAVLIKNKANNIPMHIGILKDGDVILERITFQSDLIETPFLQMIERYLPLQGQPSIMYEGVINDLEVIFLGSK